MRNKFEEQLALLNQELIAMGALCEDAISTVCKALIENDSSSVQNVNATEVEIDQKERDIESLCMKLLMQQQPVAKDLRLISAALKMITDMERIGDQAADIAEIVTLSNISRPDDAKQINDMANATIKMVTDSIDAFVNKNVALAESVIEYDDVVDNLFDQVKKALVNHFGDGGDVAEHTIDTLMVAKYFERIGDHAVNIAEWVVFSITGYHKGGTPL
jgi:phosphate transport system protein